MRRHKKRLCSRLRMFGAHSSLFAPHGSGLRYSRNSTNHIDEGVLRIRARDEREGLLCPNPDGSLSLAVRGT